MTTFDDFLGFFPNTVNTYNLTEVAAIFNQILIETQGYKGICDESARNLAVALHTMHYVVLTLRDGSGQSLVPNAPQNVGVKRLKNSKDEIEFFNGDIDLFDFSRTSYGSRLQRLLENNQCTDSIGFYSTIEHCNGEYHGYFW